MSRIDEHVPLVDLGNERPQLPARARIQSPIVPRASISGRALVAVVAIMTFLASMTTGAVLLISASATEWQSEVGSEITIQVRPQAGRNLDKDVAALVDAMRTQPGIVDTRPFTKEESASCWSLGSVAGCRSTICRCRASSWRGSRPARRLISPHCVAGFGR